MAVPANSLKRQNSNLQLLHLLSHPDDRLGTRYKLQAHWSISNIEYSNLVGMKKKDLFRKCQSAQFETQLTYNENIELALYIFSSVEDRQPQNCKPVTPMVLDTGVNSLANSLLQTQYELVHGG